VIEECGGWKVASSPEVSAERMYDITYHISSSPYYNEDMHTKFTLKLPRVLLKGVMTQG